MFSKGTIEEFKSYSGLSSIIRKTEITRCHLVDTPRAQIKLVSDAIRQEKKNAKLVTEFL